MDERFNRLTQQIFQKSLDECSTEEISRFTEQYPYFAPGHFLLLRKLGDQSEQYGDAYAKAILYYHDPLTFQHLLHPDKFDTDISFEQEVAEEVLDESAPPLEIKPLTVDYKQSEPVVPVPANANPPVNDHPSPSSTPVEELIPIEPYHTVDYFASQGIRLSQEETKDRFGRQLKSFTEWLKTMKRLPATALPVAETIPSDASVDNMAVHSLEGGEVVTEAMAEVW